MMDHAEIFRQFEGINCAHIGDGYAPHKPILILLILEKILNGHENHFRYAEVDLNLKKLLEKFGSNNASNTRNEPFWRLKNDGLLEINAPPALLQQANTPTPNQLIEADVSGKLKEEIYQDLKHDPYLIAQVARVVVDRFVSEPFRLSLLADAAPNIKLLDRNFWWVNQNQTYHHEVQGNFMWSPKTNRDGGNNPFYNFMTEMRPGDIVFSYADTYIKAIGIVTAAAVPSIKPDFGNAGSSWLDDGWLVDVAFDELKQASFKPNEHMDLISPTLPDIYSPIKPNGLGNQIYLAKIPKAMADILLGLSGEIGRAAVNELSSNLIYEMPTKEDEVEAEIKMRTDIGPTQKTQIINSRRGQGVFKANVRMVETSCRVTKVSNSRHLIASHIKPWTKSTDQEKVSGYNGLLLAPHIDHLFDKGFISFRGDGGLILSKQLDLSVLEKWQINKDTNVGNFRREQQAFLEYHRDVMLA